MYLQALLSQALRTLGHPWKRRTPSTSRTRWSRCRTPTARELGYEIAAEDAKKPFVEVSGRKGLGVKIDDLLDLLTTKAEAEVAKRNPEFTPDDCRRAGAQIAVAAIRYFMLKFSRGKLIVFDIEEALSFEGETGPYLQYAVVRAGNILHKLQERKGMSEADVLAALDRSTAGELIDESDDPSHDLWAVVFEASRLDEVVEQVVRGLEFSVLAKYAFGLAQTFNAFYHRYPILNEEDADRKRWRAAGVAYVRAQLTRALDLMGIDVPESNVIMTGHMRIAACRKLEDYRQSVLHVGGEPRIVDASMAVEQAFAGVDGLMLTGGGDIAPSRYGETAHATVVEAEPDATSSRSRWSPPPAAATCRSSRSAAASRC